MQLSLQEPVSQSPDNQRARKAVVVYMQGSGFNSFSSSMIKLSVNETQWSSLLARTRALILYISIWKFDFGPEKLPGLSRNGPLALYLFLELHVLLLIIQVAYKTFFTKYFWNSAKNTSSSVTLWKAVYCRTTLFWLFSTHASLVIIPLFKLLND